jgi:selenocysteine lyase/cysteine desulfurase
MQKREFIKSSLALGLGAFPFLNALSENLAGKSTLSLASDDQMWQEIRKQYLLKTEYINLENGYYSMLPEPLLEWYIGFVRLINKEASYYMRTQQDVDKKRITDRLAEFIDCEVSEVAITRNTTESLDLIIAGYPWESGDEAIMAEQDYGSMLDMFKLQGKLKGVVSKKIMLPNNPSSDEEIVALYKAAITPKTKLIMVCHMVNITGQILPVRKICDMAHANGVEVMVDGAHSLAHIPTTMKDLDCDYYGSSLHKWLSAPLGTGLLYIKKDKIAKISPLFAEEEKPENDIKRLNHTGTTPVHAILGIETALDYLNVIRLDRKTERLRYVQHYWSDQIRDDQRFELNTPTDSARSCGIANVGVRGMEPNELSKRLLNDHGIWTVAINRPGVKGCRITPNIYTSEQELNQFVDALHKIAG